MTVKELYHEVVSLGFGINIELNESFSSFANRALLSLFHERNVIGECKIYANGQSPLMHIEALHHIGDTEKKISLVGKAYSMRAFGRGRVVVSDMKGSFTYDFDSDGDIISGFLSGNGELLLAGSYSYTLTDLVTYPEIFSDNLSDIPDGSGRISYDIREMRGDFLSFCEPPCDRYGKVIRGANLCDGRLEIDSDFCGEINLKYRRLPAKIYSGLEDDEIDIPAEYSHVFPLLVAAYVFLDDEPERAEYYSHLYREGLDLIKKNCYEGVDAEYIDTNGWA